MARILVVEDEDNIGEVIELNLSMAGHNIVRCISAEDAQEIWDGGDRNFDLALLDIMLPGMNGVSLCEYIRTTNDNIGIIMLSAKSQERDKVVSLSVGADDYMDISFMVMCDSLDDAISMVDLSSYDYYTTSYYPTVTPIEQ